MQLVVRSELSPSVFETETVQYLPGHVPRDSPLLADQVEDLPRSAAPRDDWKAWSPAPGSATWLPVRVFPRISTELAELRARLADVRSGKPASYVDAASFHAAAQELASDLETRIAEILADPDAQEAAAVEYANRMGAEVDAGLRALGIVPPSE